VELPPIATVARSLSKGQLGVPPRGDKSASGGGERSTSGAGERSVSAAAIMQRMPLGRSSQSG
jgi:hypothetical protein